VTKHLLQIHCHPAERMPVCEVRALSTTVLILLGGLGILLAGVGLLGSVLGVRAATAAFENLEIGLIMAGYSAGYICGTLCIPRSIRNVGHVRCFAAFAAVPTATSLGLGRLVNPLVWLFLRVLSGLCVIGICMVVASWLNAQSAGSSRDSIFSVNMKNRTMPSSTAMRTSIAGAYPNPAGVIRRNAVPSRAPSRK